MMLFLWRIMRPAQPAERASARRRIGLPWTLPGNVHGDPSCGASQAAGWPRPASEGKERHACGRRRGPQA